MTPRQLRTASHPRGFFVPMDRYERDRRSSRSGSASGRTRGPSTRRTRAPATAPENHWYQLEMLPYPSGTLHMGHVLNYTMGDVLTHFRRRNGWTVLRPMGWDSFGLPAENAAIREGGHPREIVERNIDDDPRADEADRLGDRLGPRGLGARARRSTGGRSGCSCASSSAGSPTARRRRSTGARTTRPCVANEYVIDGHCERCGTLVESRNLEQWFFKITAYADELLRRARGRRLARAHEDDPAQLDRPQRGRRDHLPRRGARRRRRRSSRRGRTRCSARRSSSLAPEHPLVERSSRSDEVRGVRRGTRRAKRGEERAAEEEKTGVFTGYYATNPVNGEQLPIWVADYVLMDYGTGAIMAVPAHDERDREFAETFDLPIVAVIDEDGRAGQLRAVRRPAGRGGEEGDRRVARASRDGRARRVATACATGASRGSATGAARSRSSTATLRRRRRSPTTSCPCCCPRSRTTGRRA